MWIPLQNLLAQKETAVYSGEDGLSLEGAWQSAAQEVYPAAVSYTKVKEVKNDILYVGVSDAIWVGELETYKKRLCEKINEGREKKLSSVTFIV